PFDPARILATLERNQVVYLVIGGLAAVLYGSPLPTYDLDIVPGRGRKNRGALLTALAALDALALPDELEEGEPLSAEQALVDERDTSFYTPHGYVDVVFHPAGFRGYGALAGNAELLEAAHDLPVRVAALRDVIRSKEALGRERDLVQLPALHTLLELA
ncbi:MAG: hypothetical protein HY240_09325, partial [Actinobacteria bacterium]|nr:hypothetical protein [Actinomycetota bacterium]